MPETAIKSNVKSIRESQLKAWQREWPFTIELLPLGWLFADERYQREPIEPFIEARVEHFDATLVGTLDVSRREADSFAIMDGLQRSEIIKRVDKRAVWCTVYSGMSLKDEAEFFYSKNRERRNMHPYYALRARQVAGEKGPREIFKIVTDLGYRLGSSGGRDSDTIVAISSVEEVHKMTSLARPKGSLQPALATLQEAFGGREGANEGNIIRGLGRFYQAFYDDEIVYKNLIENLQELGPKKLVGYAMDKVTSSRHPKAFLVAHEIITQHNKGLRREKKLSHQMLHPGTRERKQAAR